MRMLAIGTELMLYYPWYSEEMVYWVATRATNAEHYDNVKAVVCENEQKYS